MNTKPFTISIKTGKIPEYLLRKAPGTWEFPIESLEPGQYLEIKVRGEDMRSAINSARALTWRTRRHHPDREYRVTKLSDTEFAIWRIQ